MSFFKEIIDYREMVFSMVKRNLRARYKASVLGFAWTFINPLLQLLVYTIVFSNIMRAGIDKFYLFLFVALIPWIAFSSTINDGCECIVSQANLVTKIYFPRQVLPVVVASTNFVNMLLCEIVVLTVCAFSIGLKISILWYLIPVIVLEYILATGLALIFSSINVYVRDLEHIMGIVIMAWQFLTPIMYPLNIVPERLLKIFYLNPMTPIVTAFRDVLYYKQAPDYSTLLSSLVFAVVFLFLGIIIFSKLQKRFAEEL